MPTGRQAGHQRRETSERPHLLPSPSLNLLRRSSTHQRESASNRKRAHPPTPRKYKHNTPHARLIGGLVL